MLDCETTFGYAIKFQSIAQCSPETLRRIASKHTNKTAPFPLLQSRRPRPEHRMWKVTQPTSRA